jgi:hypothetical protein
MNFVVVFWKCLGLVNRDDVSRMPSVVVALLPCHSITYMFFLD